MDEAGVRRRRAGSEVRSLVLAAATELFEDHGYAGTRTRDIAAAAGVTEHAIYRHFGSKAELYAAAVLSPFTAFVDAYLEEVDRLSDDLSLEDVVQRFVAGFFALLHEHRATLRAALAGGEHGDPGLARVAQDLARRFTETLERTRDLLGRQRDRHGLLGVSTTTTWAAMVGMILAVVLHDDVLFGDGPLPDPAEQVDELVTLILHGIAHRA